MTPPKTAETPSSTADRLMFIYSHLGIYFGLDDAETVKNHAKKCALICVGEVIESLVDISVSESGAEHIDYGQNFWREVKTAIETLN